jgi:hypothetical protein
VRNKIFYIGPTRAAKAEKNLVYRQDKPNGPNTEGPLAFVLFESQFTSVSSVSRGHPSLFSLLVYLLTEVGFLKVPKSCVEGRLSEKPRLITKNVKFLMNTKQYLFNSGENKGLYEIESVAKLSMCNIVQ